MCILPTYQALVADQLPREPQEGLLEVVVGLGRDVVVLEVLLAVEGDGLGLDLPLLHIHLVAGQDDGDVLANAHQVTVPVGHVLVGDARGDIEHDDAALAVDVVSVAQTAKLLLAGRVPHIELDLAEVGGEGERVDFDTEGGDVLLLELARQMALDEGGLRDEAMSAGGLPPHSFHAWSQSDVMSLACYSPCQYRHHQRAPA